MREDQNRELTEVGAGTPAGELFRRYWQPVALLGELERRNPMPVHLLGEKLCLFRDKSGRIGLIDDRPMLRFENVF